MVPGRRKRRAGRGGYPLKRPEPLATTLAREGPGDGRYHARGTSIARMRYTGLPALRRGLPLLTKPIIIVYGGGVHLAYHNLRRSFDELRLVFDTPLQELYVVLRSGQLVR